MISPVHQVSDSLSNMNDQLVNAAHLVGRSKIRQDLFEFVYQGKRQVKTIAEITEKLGISQTHALKEGQKLTPHLLEKVPLGYRKRPGISINSKKILALARDKKKLDKLPTKTSPRLSPAGQVITVNTSPSIPIPQLITIDDIKVFARAHGTEAGRSGPLPEDKIKAAFQTIIGERGTFKDWGGEKSDLFTTRLVHKGRRRAVAIAFKGQGTKGKLVPGKMGSNGDQVERLFNEPAELFLIVYCGQIDPSILTSMAAFAVTKKALGGQRVCYGIIDDQDLGRLIAAYPEAFI